MALATLSIDIVAKLANLEDGLTRATRLAEKNAAEMSAAFDKVSATITRITRVAAPLLSGFTVTGFILSTAKAVDALNDVADATGASIEKLSGLEEVAQLNGGTLDDVAGILVKFNGALKEADGKNGVSQALQAIGLQAEDLKQLDPADALQKVAVALAGYSDSGGKARIVQDLFGKSIREAAPFLKDLAEKGDLNKRVTKEQAEQAERFNKALSAMATQASQTSRILVGELLPAITKILEGFNKGGIRGAFDQTGGLFGLDGAFYEFRNKVKPLQTEVQSLEGTIGTLKEAMRADPSNPRFAAILEDRREQLKNARKALDVATETYFRLNSTAGAERGSVNPDRVKPDLALPPGKNPGEAGAKIGEVDRYIRSLEEATLRELEVGEAGKLAFKETELLAKGATAAQIAYIRNLADGLDKLKQKSQQFGEDPGLRRLISDVQAAADANERMQKLLAQTPSGQASAQQFQMGEVFDAFKNGRLGTVVVDELGNVSEASAEAQQRFVELSAQVLNLGDQTQPAFDRIGEASDKLRKTLDETIGSALYEALGGNFDNIEKAWGNMLKRMLADALATDLRNKIFGENKAGGLGDLLGGFGKLFGGFFADGGNLGAGKWGIAGEAGPEIIHGPANITPMSRAAAGHTFIVNVGQGVTPEQLQLAVTTMGRAVRAQVKGEVFQSIRRDGAFA